MDNSMDLNKETAHRLWVQQFGKKQKAFDFSGREIAKAAYNDRNSEFGWNVDHILPQSRGGKTADHNLICCHILTNDEKSNKFPCFVANGKRFEIQKRQNHYEIVLIEGDETDDKQRQRLVNFLDSAQGIQFWESQGNRHYSQRPITIGYIKIFVELYEKNEQEFFRKYKSFLGILFESENVFTHMEWNETQKIRPVCVRKFYPFENDPVVSDSIVALVNLSERYTVDDLVDDCITLNTYNEYFVNKGDAHSISAVCGAYEDDQPLFAGSHALDKAFKNIGDPNERIPGFSAEQFLSNLAFDTYIQEHSKALSQYAQDHDLEMRKKSFFSLPICWKTLQENLNKHIESN